MKKITKKYQMGGKAPVKKSTAAIADENDRAGADSYADYMNAKMKADSLKKANAKKPVLKAKPKMKMGGKMAKSGGSFPDLNKDGKVTKADVLVGRGVIKAKKGAKMGKCRYGCK